MIPTAPIGATVDSLLIATSRLDDSLSSEGASRRFYGARHPGANPFARHAATLSANAFADLISPEQLVLNHSAWPIYSCLVSRRSAQAWFQRTRDGTMPRHAPEIHSPVQSELFASRWRSCGSCISLHQQKYGTGHWMVIHQLPGISFCPTHREALCLECGACGAALGGAGLDRLPGEPCSKCGTSVIKRTEAEESPGERHLASLYASLLNGQATELDARCRESLLQSANALLLNDVPRASLEQFVLSEFDCRDAEALGHRLKVAVSSRLLRLALTGTATHAVPAPLHLAVIAVAMVLLKRGNCPVDEARHGADLALVDNDLQDEPDLPDDVLEELLALAADYNISSAAIREWFAGVPAGTIEKRGLATLVRLRGFARSLPKHLSISAPTSGPARVELAQRGATQEERRSAHRDRIQRMIDAGAHNRTLLLSRCSHSYKWALKFDRNWLDALMPAWKRGKPG